MIESFVGAALWAILVSCGFGVVLFALVAGIVRARALDAAIRHALWTIALCTTAVMPIVALTVGVVRAERAAMAPATYANPVSSDRSSYDPRAGRNREGRNIVVPAKAAPRERSAQGHGWQPHPGRTLALIIVVIWLAGAAIGLGELVKGLARVRGLKWRSSPLDAQLAADLPWLTQNRANEREIYLRLSYEIETPVAVGFRRPTILIPMDLATQGGLGAIEGLILHEHAHLRRRDDWSNLVQRVIERIFWFNPLVWIFGQRIALDREIAADDAVVATTGRPEAYAQSLWQLAREMRMPEHTIVAPGALYTRKQISVRIEALLERRPVPTPWRATASLVTAFAALGCTVAAAVAAPSVTLPILDPVAATSAPVANRTPRTTHTGNGAQVPRSVDRGGSQDQPQLLASSRDGISSPAERERATYPHAATTRQTIRQASVPIAMRPRLAGPVVQLAPVAPVAAVAPVAPVAPLAYAASAVRPASAARPAPTARPAVLLAEADVAPFGVHCHDCDLRVAAKQIIDSSDMSGADLRGVDWRGRTVRNVNLSGADLAGAQLDDMHFINSDLTGADLSGASLRNTSMTGTSVDGATFKNARTAGLQIVGVSLAGVNFRNLDVRSIVAACSGCDMSGTELRGADLHGLRLAGMNFSGSDLRAVNLRGATLVGVNLSGVDLRDADLRDTVFTGCTLDGAELRGASRDGARFFPAPPTDDHQ